MHSFYSLYFHAKYAIVSISSSIFLNSLEKTNYHNTHRVLLINCNECKFPALHRHPDPYLTF